MLLFKRHDFALIWTAGLLAYIGSGMFFVALPIWVYQEYGSATLVGTVSLMAVIPSVLLGSFSGIFVDRWDRRRVMLTATITRATLLVMLAIAVRFDAFWLVLIARLGTATTMAFFRPAEHSLLPRLVEGEAELTQANSLNQLNNNLGSVIGSGAGGLLLVWIGMEGIALVMTLLGAGGAILLPRLRIQDQRNRDQPAPMEATQSLMRSIHRLGVEWRDGMVLFIRHPSIRILMLIVGVSSVSNVGFTTLLAVFALETLDVSEAGVGFILMAGSVGGTLGAILLGLMPATIPTHRLLQWSLLVGGLLELVFYGYPLFTAGVLVVSLAIEFVSGFPNAGANAAAMTLFQTRAPEGVLGRMIGSLSAIQALVMLVATPLAGILADIFSAQAVLLVITLFLLGSWLVSLRLSEEPSRT